MENQKGGFFSGLKKMIFKEEEVPLPSQQPEPAPAKVVTPVEAESRPVGNLGTSTASLEAREDAAKKLISLLSPLISQV
ncbi:hypothetical protein LWM68_03175 [Niabella sp. W65]|nr:hypothetical protein [Niabella sp. W65]MCH7361868.1 hypothetical protein [Niabella sp. W65]ULT45626.1 hypothetical protein KRR40_21715 [Niabella sp. I65]